MGASPALALEELLEGRGLAKKTGGLGLLTGSGARLTRACDLPSSAPRESPLATGVPGLDRLLSGGLPRGGFVELSANRSSGRFSIGIAALAAATSSGEAAALVDLGGHLDPQSADAAGMDLTRLIWVRPRKLKEAVASAEMLLSAGFPLVVADLGLAPVRGRFVPDAAWVRLARAARSRGSALLLLAPYRVSGVAADAVVAMDVPRAIWRGGVGPSLLDGLSSRLTLRKDERAREGMTERASFSVFAPLSLPSPPFGGRGEEVRRAEGVRNSSSSASSPSPPRGEGRGEGRLPAGAKGERRLAPQVSILDTQFAISH